MHAYVCTVIFMYVCMYAELGGLIGCLVTLAFDALGCRAKGGWVHGWSSRLVVVVVGLLVSTTRARALLCCTFL